MKDKLTARSEDAVYLAAEGLGVLDVFDNHVGGHEVEKSIRIGEDRAVADVLLEAGLVGTVIDRVAAARNLATAEKSPLKTELSHESSRAPGCGHNLCPAIGSLE